MSSKCRESESCYNGGCRRPECKKAATDARRERRRLAREAVGELPSLDTDRTRLASVLTNNPSSSGDASTRVLRTVEHAVSLEIEALGAHSRPGLVAVALALARVLDNPKAVSTMPAAAAKLVYILEVLRRGAVGGKPKLVAVRRMTPQRAGS